MKNLTKISMIVALIVCHCLGCSAQPITSFQWAGGSVGGGWYTLAAGIVELIKSEIPEINIKVIPGAGFTNPSRVDSGDIQFAMSSTDKDAMALEGKDPYEYTHKNIRSIGASFSDNYIHVIVPKDMKINVFDEVLINKIPIKIGVSPLGTGEELGLRRCLEHYGYTYDDIKAWGGSIFYAGYADAVNLYKDRHIDLYYTHLAPPAASIIEMTSYRPSKLIPISKDLVKLFSELGFYSIESGKAHLPKDMYPSLTDEDVVTTGFGTHIMVNKDVDEDLVYKITKIICENTDRLHQIHSSTEIFDPKTSWQNVTIPLHNGAKRYYKEVGYMK